MYYYIFRVSAMITKQNFFQKIFLGLKDSIPISYFYLSLIKMKKKFNFKRFYK